MSEPILYIDSSAIREGAFEQVKANIKELVAFVQDNEPQLLSYGFYFNEERTRMTVVAVHPDSASMELHMKIGGPMFRRFAELIELQAIDVYGEPSDAVMSQLWQKAKMLGKGGVHIHSRYAGFDRGGARPTTAQAPTAAPT